MRYFLIICVVLLASCSREYHSAIGAMQFTIEGVDKAELISKLDLFAISNNLEKISEGGEHMLPEKTAVLVAAKYSLNNSTHIFIQNYLSHECFFAAAYDYDKIDNDNAVVIAQLLKKELIKSFCTRLTFFKDSRCKVLYNKKIN